MPLTVHGKRLVAESMYAKGKAFLGAGILLKQKQRGYEYVVLHLQCQGIEIILKAVLLMQNFGEYKPKLRRPFGHNLIKVADAASREFRLHPLKPTLLSELGVLNSFYSNNCLRYGTVYDILVDPTTISCHRSLRRIVAVMRLTERLLARERMG